MNYTTILREIYQRLAYHAQPERMLDGLKLRLSGEYRIEGADALPHFSFIDVNATDSRGRTTATLTAWLRVRREHGWLRDTDEGPAGLVDWMELIMDAVETRPSDGQPDQLLVAHHADGTLRLGAKREPVELLAEPFVWEVRMDEISNLCSTLQMNLIFTFAQPKRHSRRTPPAFLPLQTQYQS